MKKYGVNELRKMFLDFMESKGHLGRFSKTDGRKCFVLISHPPTAVSAVP